MNATVERNNAAQWLKIVQQQINSLRYGVVQIVVHDSHVVQIERTEKVRLNPESSARNPD